jgi:prepilin-type processing-associated H-X9-DG protein
MYMADNNDRLAPSEHRREAVEYWASSPGVGGDGWMADDDGDCPHNAIQGNPYLRWPVVLDEYVKNRDVWNCSSAKMYAAPRFINACVPDFLTYLRQWEGSWGRDADFCIKDQTFPPGWGGDVTDTLLQQRTPGHWLDQAWGGESEAHKTFTQSIGFTGHYDLKLVEVQDPTNFAICGDVGPWTDWNGLGNMAYPDLCAVECSNCMCTDSWIEDCIDNISQGCPATAECFHQYHSNSSMLRDRNLLKKGTRHLGGVNLGFLDGHAAWWNSEALVAEHKERTQAGTGNDPPLGIETWGPTTLNWAADCGWPIDTEPTIY